MGLAPYYAGAAVLSGLVVGFAATPVFRAADAARRLAAALRAV